MGEPSGSSPELPSPAPSDATEALVTAAQEGDSTALEALVTAHLDDLRAYVRLHMAPDLRVRESCSDVVQSICRDVLEDLPGFDYRGVGAFRAWLFTAALNKVRQKAEFHRAQKRDVAREVDAEGDSRGPVRAGLYASLCSADPSPSQHAVGHETAERIERAMDRLPPDYRDVLLLARVVRLSRQEIAARMQRSEASVRTLLTRAVIKLLALLEERG